MSRPILALVVCFLVSALVAPMALAGPHGLIMKRSPYSVPETIDHLEAALEERGVTVFTRIDHAANAADAELFLRPSEVLIFGNPRMGTPLMRVHPTLAIDLPQRALAYKDGKGAVWLVTNEAARIGWRHGVEGQEQAVGAIEAALDAITSEVVR